MKAGYDEVVKILIAAGADLNIAANHDIPGYTAIRIAKRVSYILSIVLLINKPTCKSNSEESFYHIQVLKTIQKIYT